MAGAIITPIVIGIKFIAIAINQIYGVNVGLLRKTPWLKYKRYYPRDEVNVDNGRAASE